MTNVSSLWVGRTVRDLVIQVTVGVSNSLVNYKHLALSRKHAVANVIWKV